MANKPQENKTAQITTAPDAEAAARAAAEEAEKEAAAKPAGDKKAAKVKPGVFAVIASVNKDGKIYEPGSSIDLSDLPEAKHDELKRGGFIADPK